MCPFYNICSIWFDTHLAPLSVKKNSSNRFHSERRKPSESVFRDNTQIFLYSSDGDECLHVLCTGCIQPLRLPVCALPSPPQHFDLEADRFVCHEASLPNNIGCFCLSFLMASPQEARLELMCFSQIS